MSCSFVSHIRTILYYIALLYIYLIYFPGLTSGSMCVGFQTGLLRCFLVRILHKVAVHLLAVEVIPAADMHGSRDKVWQPGDA